MEAEETFALEIARLWAAERVSCPHRHLLQAYLEGSLAGGARDFVSFHLEEIGCAACRVEVDELRSPATPPPSPPPPEGAEERLLSSTRAALAPSPRRRK